MNVRTVSDADVLSGQFKVEQGSAIPVKFVDDAEGGSATPIYIVSEERRKERGKPILVSSTPTRSFDGRIATPVYVVT